MKTKKNFLDHLITVFLVLILVLSILIYPVYSALPQKMNYQGYLTNASGVPINGTVQMVFSIYNVSSGGSPLWTETHSVTVSQGVYSVILGEGSTPTPINLPFDTTYYLGVQAGTDPEMTPRKVLTSVGYAFQALNSEMVGGKKLVELDNRYGQVSPVQNPRSNTLTTVDSVGGVGQYTSITIGTDGLPVISYSDVTNSDLKVVKCGNAACSSGNTLTTVDSGGDVGSFKSITIGTDGLPVISYSDFTNFDLKVAHCGNAACSSGNTLTTVDSGGDVGSFNSITICTDGLPVISYRDNTNFALKVAHCGNAACSSGNTLTTVDSGGPWTSITIGTDGLPVISYLDSTNSDLKVAHCGNAACSSGNTLTTVDSGSFTSITIGTDGLPVISYRDSTNQALKVVKCGNATCSLGTITAVDSGDVGWCTSITIGTDGLPVISYYDQSNADLKVAKCANPFCVNNWSRR